MELTSDYSVQSTPAASCANQQTSQNHSQTINVLCVCLFVRASSTPPTTIKNLNQHPSRNTRQQSASNQCTPSTLLKSPSQSLNILSNPHHPQHLSKHRTSQTRVNTNTFKTHQTRSKTLRTTSQNRPVDPLTDQLLRTTSFLLELGSHVICILVSFCASLSIIKFIKRCFSLCRRLFDHKLSTD